MCCFDVLKMFFGVVFQNVVWKCFSNVVSPMCVFLLFVFKMRNDVDVAWMNVLRVK